MRARARSTLLGVGVQTARCKAPAELCEADDRRRLFYTGDATISGMYTVQRPPLPRGHSSRSFRILFAVNKIVCDAKRKIREKISMKETRKNPTITEKQTVYYS